MEGPLRTVPLSTSMRGPLPVREEFLRPARARLLELRAAGEGALDAASAADQDVVGAAIRLRSRTALASSRKRRFIRLRTTAPPTFFETVMPKRITGCSSRRGRTSRTKPPVGARSPPFAAR